MKLFTPAVAAMLLLTSASPAVAATVMPTWDHTYTVTLSQRLPKKYVVHTMKDSQVKLYVGVKDFLKAFEHRYIPYDTKKELMAAVEQRSRYIDVIDTSLIPVARVKDEYIMALLRPVLRRRNKVVIYDMSAEQYVDTLTIRDHGMKIGEKAYTGSIDYVLPNGTVIFSEKHF